MLKIILLLLTFIIVVYSGESLKPWFCSINFKDKYLKKLKKCEEERSPNLDWDGWFKCFKKMDRSGGKTLKDFKEALCDTKLLNEMNYCTNTRYPQYNRGMIKAEKKKLLDCLAGKSEEEGEEE